MFVPSFWCGFAAACLLVFVSLCVGALVIERKKARK